MADIIAESGLSAGSIYSHFDSKNDLIRFVATELIAGSLRELHTGDAVVTPGMLFRRIITAALDDDRAPALLQAWAAAPRDQELREIASTTVGNVRASLAEALRPWAAAARPGDPDAEAALVTTTPDAIIAAAQGYAVRLALDSTVDAEAVADRLARGLDGLARGLGIP